MNAPTKPIDELLAHIATAVEQWKQENTPEVIKRTVNDLLEKESKTIVLRLLGFRSDWGRWELDNSNGRQQSSAAGEYLREHQAEAIKEFFSKVSVIPELTSKEIAQLRKSAKETYHYRLTDAVRTLAGEQADKDAKALVAKVVASDQIENYLKLSRLINPENQQES